MLIWNCKYINFCKKHKWLLKIVAVNQDIAVAVLAGAVVTGELQVDLVAFELEALALGIAGCRQAE